MSKINNYELMWILSSEDSEDSIEKTINSVKDNISNSGGEINFFENYGKRKLSYELSGNTEGNYYLSRFAMESLKINELDDKLNKDNKILRHLITSIKSTDILITAEKMDEVPEIKRFKR
tara:strand:- start:103 stop:462 length:360 start_codon:yes stop_codon:yes gene_type:complete